MTATERKRKQRNGERAAGVRTVQVRLFLDEIDFLRRVSVEAFPELTFEKFLSVSLMSGATFRANAGGKLKRKIRRAVTVSRQGVNGSPFVFLQI